MRVGRSQFSLTLQNVDLALSARIISELRNVSQMAALALNNDGSSRADVEWKEFEDDMLDFSLKYPDYFFELEYHSVEPGEDHSPWLMVFRDGGIADYFKICE